MQASRATVPRLPPLPRVKTEQQVWPSLSKRPQGPPVLPGVDLSPFLPGLSVRSPHCHQQSSSKATKGRGQNQTGAPPLPRGVPGGLQNEHGAVRAACALETQRAEEKVFAFLAFPKRRATCLMSASSVRPSSHHLQNQTQEPPSFRPKPNAQLLLGLYIFGLEYEVRVEGRGGETSPRSKTKQSQFEKGQRKACRKLTLPMVVCGTFLEIK
ncbi:hypothetical protein E2320_008095 [Naja naja]|nr:hypothetical protein E2320_008095 [Naja naja]